MKMPYLVFALLCASICLAGTPKADWVNVGSNSGRFGFDWDAVGVRGLNLASCPQGLRKGFERVKEHRAEIADGAYVIIPLCPFTSVVPPSYDNRPTKTTHPLLPFDGEPPEKDLVAFRDLLDRGWKREFTIRDYADPMTASNRASYVRMVETGRAFLAWCRAEKLKPVLVYPPAAKCFDTLFPDSFMQAYVYDFVRDIGAGDVPFYDYWKDPAFRDNRLWATSLFFNKTGRKLFTERVCRDVLGHTALRAELRAFYPDECHSPCKLAAQTNSVQAIARGIDAYVAAHPEADALDVRRVSYLEMRKHFVPILFRNLPFYFEAGVNGGWSTWSGDKAVPSRHVNAVCSRFYREKGLIPAADMNLLYDRMGNGRLLVCCGPFVDDEHHVPPFHAVFTKGFGGIRAEVAAALAKCPKDDPRGRKELETALVGLDTIHEIQLKFAAEAEKKSKSAVEVEERKRLLRIVEAASRCPWEPPRTFFEGLNTLWFVREILGYVDGVCNFSLGRPDAWLIDFYRADLKAGRLTEAEGRKLVEQFLIASDCHLDDRLFLDRPSDQEAEMPLTLGGAAADGSFVWNELTEAFLDAHLRLDLVFPKLHCRISENAPQAYLEKIGDMLMKDHAVFALFNDDRHIPQFLQYGIPLERARDYVGTGCWDGNVDTWTDVDCANYVSVARILEMTIYRNPADERRYRVAIDPIDGAASYEEVEETVYCNFIRFFRDVLGAYTRYGRANAQVFPHPAYSMCLEGCRETRRDTTDGGTRFRPRVVTLAFMANVVDSLCAIRKVCFEDRAATLGEFLEAVRTNWAGEKGRRLRALAMSAPYWGDNTDASTSVMRRWIDRVHGDIADLRNDQGGPYVLSCWIYREFVNWGAQTKATPDGRHDGDRLAQGFAPSEFRCKEGASSVIGALGKLDHSKLYASNANLMFERGSVSPEAFAAIFRVACASGMHLLQPNCASVEDLLDAQVHPERHQNIIVKVCGFSARFITLSKRWQDEIIARHRLK